MPLVHAQVTCPIYDSFRVRQVAGLFDVPLADRARREFTVELPHADEAWEIGLIVGPSGSGKSTVARAHFGGALREPADWPPDAAVIDGFGESPTKQVTAILTAVGFSSPPSWIKPYQALSGGEQFRCDLARALLSSAGAGEKTLADESVSVDDSPSKSQANAASGASSHLPIVVFDEFTSVVDRVVARCGSAAVAKAIRSGLAACRFVAVTCHYDVAEWLEPDWVVDMATRVCQRRRLWRPPIRLELYRCHRSAWPLFADHHYLTGALSPTARCHLALWERRPVAFCATLPVIGRRRRWRISRLVTLPDYQGLGIGTRVAEAVGDLHIAEGHQFGVTTSHPAMIRHCWRSSAWRLARMQKIGRRRKQLVAGYRDSFGRSVASFNYLGARSGENSPSSANEPEDAVPTRPTINR